MAYGNQTRPAAQSNYGRAPQAKSPAVAGKTPTAKPTDVDKPAGNKPAFRLAIVEKDSEGKYKTIKGEDGRTQYCGAAWANQFDGFNVKIESDIPAGSQVRLYPVTERTEK